MDARKFRSQIEVLSVVDKGRRREWTYGNRAVTDMPLSRLPELLPWNLKRSPITKAA